MPPSPQTENIKHIENERLRQELAQVQREKADLELLIESNIEHSDFVTDGLFDSLESAKTNLQTKIKVLHREVIALRQAVEGLQQEKVDLELMLDMNMEHSDSVAEDLLDKVESTLRESEKRFRVITETTPVPIFVCRKTDNAIVFANGPTSQLVGVSQDRIIGQSFYNFFYDDEQSLLSDILSTQDTLSNFELQGHKQDGSIFWGSLSIQSLTFKNEPCRLMAIFDLTKRKQVEEEIRQLNEELEERVAERTQQLNDAHDEIIKLEKASLETKMAGGFAHEMRNALAGAKMVINTVIANDRTLCEDNAKNLGELFDLIQNHIPKDKWNSSIGYFESIEKNAQTLDHVLKLVNGSIGRAMGVTTEILEYSRLGHSSAGLEPVDLKKLIESIQNIHEKPFKEQGVELRTQLITEGTVSGKESHFHSILNNIIINARDALLEVTDDRQRMIEVTLEETNLQQIITVRDNAGGIPEDHLKRIFDPFFSTKPTTGTGLGLNVVFKLIEMYNGTVNVSSEIGQGTCFTLTFDTTSEENS